MADVKTATCSFSPAYGNTDVRVDGDSVSFTSHPANASLGILAGAAYRETRTYDISAKAPRTVHVEGWLASVKTTDVIGPIRRNPNAKIAYNRCANQLSRAMDPLWRPVRKVAHMF